MEKDTPGTVFGITQKTDGKSKNSSTFDNVKTQGEHDDQYKAHDRSGDEEYQSRSIENQRAYKILGIAIVMILAYQLLFRKNNEYDANIIADFAVKQQGIKTEDDLREQYKDNSFK